MNELNSILKYSNFKKYLSKEDIEILLDSLEKAKMLQPLNPLDEEKNGKKEEDPAQKHPNYNSVNPFNNFKSFFRMQYMRNEELQKEFYSLVFSALFPTNQKEDNLKKLMESRQYKEAVKYMNMVNDKLLTMVMCIQSSKHQGVPLIAVEKSEKLIEYKTKVVDYMETEMKKCLDIKTTPQQEYILEKCSPNGFFFVSPAEEVFLGTELYIPKKQSLLIIHPGDKETVVSLGFLYTNENGLTRLVTLTKSLILNNNCIVYSNKGVTILDGDSGSELNFNNAFRVRASILSGVMKNKNTVLDKNGAQDWSTSNGLRYLAGAHTAEEISAAVRYINIHEPEIMYLSLGQNGPSRKAFRGLEPRYNNFLQAFLPAHVPSISILEGFVSSQIRYIMQIIYSKQTFSDTHLLPPINLSRENLFIDSVFVTSMKNSKFIAAFILKDNVHCQAINQLVKTVSTKQLKLFPDLKTKVSQMAKRR
ncbi:uncharacterized protein LOC128884394 isoform X2 [Hylaeus volcanicus]|nr:uncharacterized protein LOC128884394 isoform X2 [Hylaeus volcanicus]XP_053993750.1 uncharacterized protein LOC128884394 isoform X2 [Hylaeus volcanicus]